MLGVLDLRPHQYASRIRIDAGANRSDWPSKTRPGSASTATCNDCPTRSTGLSFSATLASIHIVSMSATVYGAGALPGLHEQTWRRIARRDAAGDRARHDQRRIGPAIGDDAVDIGIGFAKNTHGVARGAQIAFGSLLIRSRLLDIVLRHRARRVELAQAGRDFCCRAPARRPPRSRSIPPATDRGCRW